MPIAAAICSGIRPAFTIAISGRAALRTRFVRRQIDRRPAPLFTATRQHTAGDAFEALREFTETARHRPAISLRSIAHPRAAGIDSS